MKTRQPSEMILVHYGAAWESKQMDALRSILSLTIDEGRPKLYARQDAYLTTMNDMALNDGKWHHIAVSMPETHCRLSEVDLYIDGYKEITQTQNDERLFFIPYGRISLGGLGYSASNYETWFPNWLSYQGSMDEFILWGRKITPGDLAWSMHKNYYIHKESLCAESTTLKKWVFEKSSTLDQCRKRCKEQAKCFGYEHVNMNAIFEQCTIYYDRPWKGASRPGSICAFVR